MGDDEANNTGNSDRVFTEYPAASVIYTKLPGGIPVELTGRAIAEIPVEDDDFFDNETYRIELAFLRRADHTKIEVRLRAKGASRYSIGIGNYRIGKLTKSQLARVTNKTLPASVKRAITEGNLEPELIFRILARRGKGESVNNRQDRRKGIRRSRLAEGDRKGRKAGPSHQRDSARWEHVDHITESRGIN